MRTISWAHHSCYCMSDGSLGCTPKYRARWRNGQNTIGGVDSVRAPVPKDTLHCLVLTIYAGNGAQIAMDIEDFSTELDELEQEFRVGVPHSETSPPLMSVAAM